MTEKSADRNELTLAAEIALAARRSAILGFWSLLVFVILGIFLEAFHGLKVGFYLAFGSEMRRLMWTLCHAHGVALAVIQLLFAATLRVFAAGSNWPALRIATQLIWSQILMSGGFFLAGLFAHQDQLGSGIFFVPIGAFLLLLAISSIAWQSRRVRVT